MSYTIAFKASMVKRMTGRSAVSAASLAEENGVSQSTLSRWMKAASKVTDVSREHTPKPKRLQDWTPLEKLKAVAEADDLEASELGAYLRRKGLHAQQLEAWREAATAALASSGGKRRRTAEQKQIRSLERDLNRKDRALAETTALLVLKKKFDLLFEDGDDDMSEKSDK